MEFALAIAQERTSLGTVHIDGVVITYIEQGQAKMAINLAEAAKAYSRLDDVATCSLERAPELLAALGKGYREINDAVGHLEAAVRRIKYRIGRRRSLLLIGGDEPAAVATILKLRGLSDTKAHQDAVLALDPQVIEMEDTCEALASVLGLLKPRKDVVRDAWSAVKAMFGQPGGPRTPSISGGAGDGRVGTTQGFGNVIPRS